MLTQLLLDPNLYSRGQAVEIFLSLTDCDTYDWFLPISSNLHHLSLYREMYCLLDTPFLQNLLSNRTGSFPGGSMRCLQLLAFWLSWLRVHFTEQNKLKLHASLLNVINLWAIESEVESDESKLAMTLFEDFSTAGVYDFHSDHITSRSLLQGVISPPAFHPEVSEIVSPNQLEHFVLGRNNLKEKGNKYFAEAKYMEALGCYKSAIDEIEGSESVVEDCKLLATLYYNSANTYWKLSQQTQAVWSPTPNSFENFVDACITCCKRCLDLDPLYFKARYRFASTMQQLGRYEEALPYLDTKFLQPDLIPDQKMLDLLQDLRRTCIAQIIILQKETQSGFIDDRTSRILSQIALRRNHQQESPTISASSSGACDTSKSTSSPEIKLSKNSSISKRALKYLTKIRSCVALLNTQHRSDSPEIIQLTITLGKV